MPYKDKDKQREYQRKWVAKRRANYLVGKRCGECDTTDDLHMHHRDPETKITHRVWTWSIERRDQELSKCDVLCGTCHRQQHSAVLDYTCDGCGTIFQRLKSRDRHGRSFCTTDCYRVNATA